MDKTILVVKALDELAKGKQFVVTDNGIEWQEDYEDLPTQEQIQAKIKELEAQAKIDAKYDSCKNYILQHYSTTKQQSDQADKEYFSTLIKANGVKDLETEIVLKVQDFFKGATLESLVEDVSDENKEAYIQLIKVGIRVTWVQMCKQELRKAIEEDREPNFPEYPL